MFSQLFDIVESEWKSWTCTHRVKDADNLFGSLAAAPPMPASGLFECAQPRKEVAQRTASSLHASESQDRKESRGTSEAQRRQRETADAKVWQPRASQQREQYRVEKLEVLPPSPRPGYKALRPTQQAAIARVQKRLYG
jgi:hypothetical protein